MSFTDTPLCVTWYTVADVRTLLTKLIAAFEL